MEKKPPQRDGVPAHLLPHLHVRELKPLHNVPFRLEHLSPSMVDLLHGAYIQKEEAKEYQKFIVPSK